jgi:hypothetical protein
LGKQIKSSRFLSGNDDSILDWVVYQLVINDKEVYKSVVLKVKTSSNNIFVEWFYSLLDFFDFFG